MFDRHFWLHSWKSADLGCKRKLLRSKAISHLESSRNIKYIDPMAHSLYKIWITGRYGTKEDVALKSYRQMAELTKDTAPLWRRPGAAAHHP
jgi:hypothetical protein